MLKTIDVSSVLPDLDQDTLLLLCLAYSNQGFQLTQQECSVLSHSLGEKLTKKEIHGLFSGIQFTKETDLGSFFFDETTPPLQRDLFFSVKRSWLHPYILDLKHEKAKSKSLQEGLESLSLKDRLKPLENDQKSFNHTLICLSDLHIGQFFSVDGVVKYDLRIAKERLSSYLSRVRQDLLKNMPQKVTILLLGDLVDGVLPVLRPSMPLEQEIFGKDQIRVCTDLIYDFCMGILSLEVSGVVEVLSVAGNHDRIGQGRDDDEQRLAAQYIMDVLSAKLPKDRFKCVMADQKILYVQLTPNCRGIINHGDARVNPQELVLFDILNPAKYRVVIEGHIHNRNYTEHTGYCKITSPSLVGESSYSYNFIAKKSLAGQMCVCIEERESLRGDVCIEVNPRFYNLE